MLKFPLSHARCLGCEVGLKLRDRTCLFEFGVQAPTSNGWHALGFNTKAGSSAEQQVVDSHIMVMTLSNGVGRLAIKY
jgi:hypothetical protein